MKKIRFLIFPLLAIILALLACAQGGNVPLTFTATPPETPSFTETATFTQAPPPTFTATTAVDYSGPCANVFYPFVPGNQWIYQKLPAGQPGIPTPTPDPITSRFGIKVVEINNSQAILDSLDLATGAITRTTADCQEDAITNFPMMTLGSLFGNYLAGDIQTRYVSGFFAPPKADLDASGWNMQWQGEYTASGKVTVVVEGESTTLTLNNSPVRMTWRNVGQETITVPAGTYENAYKVTRTAEMDASIDVEGLAGRGTLTIETVHWFAPYVGLLKTEVASARLTLFAISFPIEMAGSAVELLEFQPGH